METLINKINTWCIKNKDVFGFTNIFKLKVSFLKSGQYNINYLIRMNKEAFVLRLNIMPQSGLENQISYEYKTLKFLEPFGITPRVFYYCENKEILGYPFLIQEFIKGDYPKPNAEDVKKLARVLYRLHSIKVPKKLGFLKRDLIEEDLKIVKDYLEEYKKKDFNDSEVIKFCEENLRKIIPRKFNQTVSFVHTDIVPSNALIGECAFIIDWEKGRCDDPSYDIAIIFSDFMYWDWETSLTQEQKKLFINEYPGFEWDEYLWEKVNYRTKLLNILGVLWAATRLSEIKSGEVSREVSSDIKRYEKTIEYIISRNT